MSPAVVRPAPSRPSSATGPPYPKTCGARQGDKVGDRCASGPRAHVVTVTTTTTPGGVSRPARRPHRRPLGLRSGPHRPRRHRQEPNRGPLILPRRAKHGGRRPRRVRASQGAPTPEHGRAPRSGWSQRRTPASLEYSTRPTPDLRPPSGPPARRGAPRAPSRTRSRDPLPLGHGATDTARHRCSGVRGPPLHAPALPADPHPARYCTPRTVPSRQPAKVTASPYRCAGLRSAGTARPERANTGPRLPVLRVPSRPRPKLRPRATRSTFGPSVRADIDVSRGTSASRTVCPASLVPTAGQRRHER